MNPSRAADPTPAANFRPSLGVLALAALALALAAAPVTGQARSSDRDQPMEIDAEDFDGVLSDDSTLRLRRNVQIVQGTLNIQADAADVSTRAGEIARVVLTGSPARMRQVDDAGLPMNARANRIDYDLSGNSIVLTGSVEIEQPRGNLSGERVVYNLDSGQINAGGEGGRVRMVIQPARRGEG
ncbi:lipopolysaccharide transport periplasmic protein LptA [Alkalisalibacterium limincola]|uniref:Lipopolysaccharide export system protein LptA n=1 Tax=Alkalisalibacterium limincola TaxID=2699169 RepID=A0A5C8KZN1_9GAMM|nr:lipopolysaccharide transport periplasmic protein LptA [Alkalisalibacterium limincola]TXK65077.1 lipopolysaccharide transport periplasmic protein LptA [Alkalisalibacterium limincola]